MVGGWLLIRGQTRVGNHCLYWRCVLNNLFFLCVLLLFFIYRDHYISHLRIIENFKGNYFSLHLCILKTIIRHLPKYKNSQMLFTLWQKMGNANLIGIDCLLFVYMFSIMRNDEAVKYQHISHWKKIEDGIVIIWRFLS